MDQLELSDQLDLPTELKAAAVPLAELHVREVAWSRANALRVLDQISGQSVAVLGGDVLEAPDGRMRYAYSNWHAERNHDESFSEYAARSIDAARRYINDYPQGPPEPFFVLVLRFGPRAQVT